MSKLCRDGLTPTEAADWMLYIEPEWRCSYGNQASKGNIMKMKRKIQQKQKIMQQVNNGVTVFVNGKPQK